MFFGSFTFLAVPVGICLTQNRVNTESATNVFEQNLIFLPMVSLKPSASACRQRNRSAAAGLSFAIQAKQASISLSARGVMRTGFMNPRSAAAVSRASDFADRQASLMG
jgi:hypothetical protein